MKSGSKPHPPASFRINWLVAAVLLAMLALTACSGSDSDDDDDDAAQATVTAAVATGESATVPAAATTPAPDAGAATGTASVLASPTPTTTASPTASPSANSAGATATTASEVTVLAVFFIRDEKVATAHRTVPRTQQVAAAAMAELLAGPTEAEAAAGLTTSIPEGTRYIGTTIDQGIATVDLSGEFESGGGSLSMMARLAQVVYTLTQFPTVDFVTFTLDGEPATTFGGEGIILDSPVSRQDFEELTPAIFVASPAVNDEVESPLRITGTANTFEAAFVVQILADDGTVLVEEPAMATSGSGTRGTFDLMIPFEAEPGSAITLRVFEQSARDGSDVNVVEIPLVVEDGE